MTVYRGVRVQLGSLNRDGGGERVARCVAATCDLVLVVSCNARDRENWLESRVTRKSTTLGNRERFKQLSIVLLMACGVWTYDHLHYLIICPDRQ